MELSARSSLNAGMAFTAAAAVAFTPLVIPANHHTATIPAVIQHVSVPGLRLAAAPNDIEAAIAVLAELVGLPGEGLIKVVETIVTLIDTGFSGLIDVTADPTAAASLTILKTLSVDAFAKLHENLGLINPVLTTTTEQVAKLVWAALTGSVQNMLTAVTNVVENPLSFDSYAGVFNAGIASGRLLVGNGLHVIQTIGDAGFDVVGIALGEVSFQLNNLVGGVNALLTQLGDASGVPVVEVFFRAVQDLVLAPALAVFNFGAALGETVLTTANAGFDLVLETARTIVDPPQVPELPATDARPEDSPFDDGLGTAEVQSTSATSTTAKVTDDAEPTEPVDDGSVATEETGVEATQADEVDEAVEVVEADEAVEAVEVDEVDEAVGAVGAVDDEVAAEVADEPADDDDKERADEGADTGDSDGGSGDGLQ
ncbi:Uncharacterised protein [Mycolicibacterium vanbaalenii]|uniref:Uncharacterized protein n=1 Tax=Mycolicibacterium vanbaalenii TaxID=110539 RepID=A0A5S9QHE3_MYCVN|nr:hypothetical protein [Mycolicibacterium vanbaalenii]CAA0117546.1 Uncharacterised protein [Mycolicibacterium vanbaalenii]